MTYQDQQRLSAEPDFLNRIWSCICTEAQPLLPADATAVAVLSDPWRAVASFVPFLATAPGFGDKYAMEGGQANITDNEILASVQAHWGDVQIPSAATP